MHQRYFKAFEDELPYNVAFIELEEGPLLISRLIDVLPDNIRCEMSVELTFDADEPGDATPLPRFRPVGGA